jgi:hypothetical protein
MKDETRLRRFLNLFAYGEEDSKRKECVQYIMDVMAKAESEKKVLRFDRLAATEYIPNPCVDSSGTLFIDTRKMWQMYDEWRAKVRFIEIEAASLVHENYMIMRDIAKNPPKK